MENAYRQLKENLQSTGALRPDTWTFLLGHLQDTTLKAGEGFIRRDRQIAYVVEGLLKECDSSNRKRPAIINFPGSGSFLVSNAYTVSHYLKACSESRILYLQAEPVWLYRYKELSTTWDAILWQYEQGVFYRQYLLEMKQSTERIETFKTHFAASLKYMSKKEMANYLNLNYHHFTRLYR